MNAPFPRPVLKSSDEQIAALIQSAKDATATNTDHTTLADLIDALVVWHEEYERPMLRDLDAELSAADDVLLLAERLRDESDARLTDERMSA